MDEQELCKKAMELGATGAGVISLADVTPDPQFRDLCALNYCGRYQKSWTCPPGCGSLDQCAARLREYARAVVVQLIHPLEDSLDVDGMNEGQQAFDRLMRNMQTLMMRECPGALLLGAGSCTLCEACTYPDAPCRASAACHSFGGKLRPGCAGAHRAGGASLFLERTEGVLLRLNLH